MKMTTIVVLVSWRLAVDYNLRQLFFWQIATLLCGEVQISRETSTFAYKPQTNVVMFFLLIIFIISMILNIFIILQEFDLPLPIVNKKATKGRKNVFFLFILIFLPSLLTTLSCDCYTFCGCNFVGLVTPKTMAEVQSLERLPMTLIPGPPPKSKTNEQMQQ